MRETSVFPAGLDNETLLLTRMRGFVHLMPDSKKWKLSTKSKEECWLCEEHLITLYIWTPKIGLL